jgi:O-antigen/teichoic acid export membrane protein
MSVGRLTSLRMTAVAMAVRPRPLARKALGLSGMTALGQMTFVLALPLLSRLFSPADFGLFTIYLSIANIGGPIAALKFDSAIYSAPSREEARPILALAIFSTTIVSLGVAALVTFLGGHLPGALNAAPATLVMLTPAGILLAGLWSATSAWAVRCGAISTLATARFLQPAAMTALQLAAGLLGWSATVLILAHLASHALYSSFILIRTLRADEARQIVLPRLANLARDAKRHRLFPYYVMPANVASQLVANAPPVLLGALYGAGVAGHCGMAYRLVFAPTAIVSLSLGHVLTATICGGARTRAIRALSRKILLVSAIFVAGPILFVGLLAPHFAGLVLGERWALTGQVVFAFSILGAIQALAIPFSEITSAYRFQKLRFSVEATTTALVFAAIFCGAALRFEALSTIWLMTVAGAAGSAIGLARILFAFRRRLENDDHVAEFPPASPIDTP